MKKFLIDDSNSAEYVRKIGSFIKRRVYAAKAAGVVIGMSGGIDCCVAAALAHNAEVKVLLHMLPDGKAPHKDAFIFADMFKMEYKHIDICPICAEMEKDSGFTPYAHTNIRPRVRMTILYAAAQTRNLLVVGTGNLSERTVGYFTKWGDGAGDMFPLAMLTKREVYALARALKIPQSIIDKKPSAELSEGQTDEADFGFSYDNLDDYILYGTSSDASVDKMIAARIKGAGHKVKPVPVFRK